MTNADGDTVAGVASRLPPLAYADVRDDIRDGDVLLYRGTGLVSRLIARVTGGKFTHAGFAGWARGRLWAVQFREGKGGVIVPLSADVRDHDVVLFRTEFPGHTNPALAAFEASRRERLMDWAFAQSGRPYNYRGIIRFWLSVRLGLTFVARPQEGERDTPNFCSEFVANGLRRVGIDVKRFDAARLTSPQDLARSAALAPIGKLVP